MEDELAANVYQDLIEYSGLYPETVVTNWGISDSHWFTSKWTAREHSLRHDMVCILLCNLEMLTPLDAIKDYLHAPLPKRRRLNDGTAEYESTESSGGTIPLDDNEDGQDRFEECKNEEDLRRFLLIEGMPSESEMISRICQKEGIPHPQHSFDIYDRKLKKWIEVKVTQNYSNSLALFRKTRHPNINCGFVHLNPTNAKVRMWEMSEPLPGEGKAKKFLLERAAYIETKTGIMESSLFESEDIEGDIFCCERFNKATEAWVSSWWEMRNQDPVTVSTQLLESIKNKPFCFREMAEHIEDTKKRDAPPMKMKAKILPNVILSPMTTELENDEELVSLFMDEISPILESDWSRMLSQVKKSWLQSTEKNTFKFLEKGDCEKTFPLLASYLGIGAKGTTRNDLYQDLKQPNFRGYPEAKYHPWLAELLKEISLPHNLDVSFARNLHDVFYTPEHPVAKEMQDIRRKFFQCLGESKIGEYCSQIKNFYSRMGGAYCERTQKGVHNNIAIFPLYSVGSGDEGSKMRRLSGICIRGPFHAKQATDRISFITVERMRKDCYGFKYIDFLHKAHVVNCANGNVLIVRQNSILKQDPAYLAFSYNASYLSANFMGEVFLQSETAGRERSCMYAASSFLERCGPWLMERVSESVYMAITGGSQEEGAFAIIRKIYMATLGQYRGLMPHSRDWRGLGEALNECLRDSAFALYWGEQTRRLLLQMADA